MAATFSLARRARGGPARRTRLAALGALVAGLVVPLALVTAPPASAQTEWFTNNNGIAIPSVGTANPYPSTINVSGMVGEITDLRVQVRQLTHTATADIDMFLCNPTTGGCVQLMGDTGGNNDTTLSTLTFQDGATPLPGNAGTITTGTYAPTNLPSNIGCPDSSGTGDGLWPTTLSSFDGVSGAALNGNWNLFISDDCGGDSGTIGSWRLRITTKQDATFDFTAPASAQVGDELDVTSVDTSNSTGTVQVQRLDAGTTGTGAGESCSVTGTTISFDHVGNCQVRARTLGNADFFASPWVVKNITVTKGDQVITFTSGTTANIGDAYTATIEVNGDPLPAPSGNAPVYTSTTPGVCSVNALSGAVTFTNAGNCQILAQVGGDADWLSGAATHDITVAKTNQTITIDPPLAGPAQPTVGSTFDVNGSASSALPVTYSVHGSSTPGACSVNSTTGVVSFLAPGSCVIALNQAGNANFNAAPQVLYPAMGVKNAQTIDTSNLPQGGAVGTSIFLNLPTGPSGVPVTVTPQDTAVCTVAGTKVTFKAAGTCTLTLNQAGNGSYHPAPQVLWGIQVQGFGG